jgi:hypothetical protein
MFDQVITKHHFDNFRVRDISIVPQTNLLLVVGRVSYHHKDLTDKSKAEKQLLRKSNDSLRGHL